MKTVQSINITQMEKRTGYKDEKGKIHKYVYLNHDARGNWTSRSEETGYCFEERKIIYY